MSVGKRRIMDLNKDSKIYIAGHRGMVGSAILRKFQKEGYSNLIYKTSSELDLIRQNEVENFFEREKPDFVINAAAKVGGIVANNTYPAEFIYQNLMISTNLIHSCYLFGVKKLINLGSSCIYPKNAPNPLKEEYLLSSEFEKTNEAYALSKATAIKLCEFYNREYGTNYISLMPPNLFGENDNFNMQTAHLLPMLLRRFHLAKLYENNDIDGIKNDFSKNPLGWNLDEKISNTPISELLKKIGIEKGKVTVWGDGSVYRELMYSNDVADACLYFLKNIDAKDINNFVNITSGKDIQVKNIVQIVKNIVGYQGEIVYDKTKPNGVQRKLMDATRLNSLDWKPKISLESAIEDFYKIYLSL